MYNRSSLIMAVQDSGDSIYAPVQCATLHDSEEPVISNVCFVTGTHISKTLFSFASMLSQAC